MVIFLFTFLSCSQLYSVVNRLQNIVQITPQQKSEIVLELRKVVPTCPVIIKKDGRPTI
jgi:hypothetical protein